MDAMTRSRLLSLATVRPCAKPGVTGVTGVTGPANPAGSRLSHLPLHLEGAEKAQSNQRVTPVTPCNTLEWAGAADLGPQRCNEPEAQGVTALVTPVSPAVGAEDWQAVYDERAAVREFDGGLPRGQAERLAHADTVTELREPPPGVQMTAPLATGVSTFPTSAGSELDLKTARRRGPWWDGPAWDEPEFHVGVMAEWRLGLQRLSPHREPCPGFRSGQFSSGLRGLPAVPRGARVCRRSPGLVDARPVWRRSWGRRGPCVVLRGPDGQRRFAGRGRSGCRDPLSKRARVPQGRCAGPVHRRLGLCLARGWPVRRAAVRLPLPAPPARLPPSLACRRRAASRARRTHPCPACGA